jgi:hypothetical protein
MLESPYIFEPIKPRIEIPQEFSALVGRYTFEAPLKLSTARDQLTLSTLFDLSD